MFSEPSSHILGVIIVDCGKAQDITRYMNHLGFHGTTVFLGTGSASNDRFLHAFGLDELRREIIFAAGTEDTVLYVLEHVAAHFRMERPNNGIAFAMKVALMYGYHPQELTKEKQERGKPEGVIHMGYKAIFTIVDEGLGRSVIEAGNAAGSRGGTIIHARGSGIHETATLFSFPIQPEKDMVLNLVKEEHCEAVVTSIRDSLEIDQSGKGILFVLDTLGAYGMVE